jgi:hypothetical protein
MTKKFKILNLMQGLRLSQLVASKLRIPCSSVYKDLRFLWNVGTYLTDLGEERNLRTSTTTQIYLTSAPRYSLQLQARLEVAWSMMRQEGSIPPTAPMALPDRVLYCSSIQYSLLKCWHNGHKANYRNRKITCDEPVKQTILQSLVTEQEANPTLCT